PRSEHPVEADADAPQRTVVHARSIHEHQVAAHAADEGALEPGVRRGARVRRTPRGAPHRDAPVTLRAIPLPRDVEARSRNAPLALRRIDDGRLELAGLTL